MHFGSYSHNHECYFITQISKAIRKCDVNKSLLNQGWFFQITLQILKQINLVLLTISELEFRIPWLVGQSGKITSSLREFKRNNEPRCSLITEYEFSPAVICLGYLQLSSVREVAENHGASIIPELVSTVKWKHCEFTGNKTNNLLYYPCQ